MGRVENKVAIISGAASGLGEASARLLAEEGARVLIGDIDAPAGRRLAEEIGPAAMFRRLDVTKAEDWAAAFDDAARQWGTPDILVNSAGIVVMGSIEDATLDQFRHVLAVNLEGTFLGCQAALRHMRESGGGSIINLSSVAALLGTPPDIVAYTASKGAVCALTRSVAVHCRTNGLAIRCNAILPGNMRTPMLLNAVEREVGRERLAETLEEIAKTEPIGVPQDVANMVLYLASDQAKFINGTQIVIDQGFTVT
jgi:3(or 17)beta-hydroxysteroid dehydrogenase